MTPTELTNPSFLKQCRLESGLSQTEFGIKYAEINKGYKPLTKQNVSNYETGKRSADLDFTVRWLETFGKKVKIIITD